MKTRRNMLFGLSGFGVFAFLIPVRKVIREEKITPIDLVEKFKEIKETGRQMITNRMEIYKLDPGSAKNTSEHEEMKQLRMDLSVMVAEKLNTDFEGTYLYAQKNYVFLSGVIGPANVTITFEPHVNDILNNYFKT